MLSELRIQSTDIAGAEGAYGPVRGDKSFAAAVMDSHGRYYDAVRRGNVFMAVNSAAGALTLNSTTATGLILWNPPNSGKSLVLLKLNVALASLPGGAAPLILTGGAQPTVPGVWTLITGTGSYNGVLSCYMGQGVAARTVAQAASVGTTIGAAVIQRWIPGGPAASVAGSTSWPGMISDDIAGELIVGPGQVISLQCLTTAITVGASISWEEVPVS